MPSPRATPKLPGSVLLAIVLAACGGSDGEPGSQDPGDAPPVASACPTETTPPGEITALAVSQQNAMPVAADAEDVALASGPESMQRLWSAAESVLQFLPGGVPPGQTLACPGGGTIANGNAASGAASYQLAGCRLAVDGAAFTGSVTLRVVSSSVGPGPAEHSRTLEIGVRDFVMEAAGQAFGWSGDLRVEDVAASRFGGTNFSGTALAYATCAATGGRNVTLRDYDYRQDFALVSAMRTRTASARVESRNPRLGAGITGYGLSTPQPLTEWSSRPSGGTIAASGPGSRLRLITLPAESQLFGMLVFNLGVDTNGDGVDDFTIDRVKVEDLKPFL